MGGDFGADLIQLSAEDCEQRMKEIPLWELAPDRKSIFRTFAAKSFAEGLKFFNQIAQLAEVEGHHPVKSLTQLVPVIPTVHYPLLGGNLIAASLNCSFPKCTAQVWHSEGFLLQVWGWGLDTFYLLCQLGYGRIERLIPQDLHLTDSRTVSLVLSTPAVQGLSLQDFNLAIRIDESDVQYSPKWIKENPHLLGYISPQADDSRTGSEILKNEDVGKGGVDALKLDWPQLVPDAELEDRLKAVSDWQLSQDRRFISRTFQARNFTEGIKFFNSVAQIAEEAGHHPDLHLTDYQTVTIVLMTAPLRGLSMLDFNMAARINNIDVQFMEISVPERKPSLHNSVSWVPDSSPPIPKAQLPDNQMSGEEDNRKDKPTLLHSLILIYAEAGATGLSVQEAAKKIREQQLPGLQEKAKAVQIAKITRNHPDFVQCDAVGGFALRKPLLKGFRDGSLDPEEYADEKKREAIVLERYVSSMVPTPSNAKAK